MPLGGFSFLLKTFDYIQQNTDKKWCMLGSIYRVCENIIETFINKFLIFPHSTYLDELVL